MERASVCGLLVKPCDGQINTYIHFTSRKIIAMYCKQPPINFWIIFGFMFSQGAQAASVLTPEQLKYSLLQGSDSQLTELSKNLHLVIPKRSRVGATADIPCTEFDSVEISHISLPEHNSPAVIKAFSSSCQYSYLVVLAQTKSNAWEFVQTIPLWSKNKIPMVSFESLTSSKEQAIVVQNYEADYGSGVSQTSMIIWKPFKGGYQVVFDEPSQVIFSVPIDKKGFENTDQSEDSEFTFVKGVVTRGESANFKYILQKQVIRDHQTIMTRWWRFLWVPEMNRFQKYPAWH